MQWFLSVQDSSDRLTPQATDWPGAAAAASPSAAQRPDAAALWLDPSRKFQTLEGFGGAFTEAAASVWSGLGDAARVQLLRDYFDPASGHGYSLCRVHMNSCDFSLGNYAHAEVSDDFALEHFNIDRDRQALLPFVQAAQAIAPQPIKLLVSAWSPPAWMKTNARMNDGGRLKPECRSVWAQCFVRFIQAYAAAGVPVWGVSLQNEPEAHQVWDSCLYSAEDERDFIRDHLGPALAQADLGHVRIVIWDHNRDQMVERAGVVYADADAAKFVWGTGFHWYGEDHFDHVQQVHDAWPDKHLLFTEGCQEGGPHHGEWAVGERYARNIINDLNRWTVGWIDWNLLLDHRGGPNHVGNYCSAPILTDEAGTALKHQPAYWALGHFARFIRPGAQRVLCAANRSAIEATAFVNVDGSLAVVVLNRTAQPLRFALRGMGLPQGAVMPPALELPPRSMVTGVMR